MGQIVSFATHLCNSLRSNRGSMHRNENFIVEADPSTVGAFNKLWPIADRDRGTPSHFGSSGRFDPDRTGKCGGAAELGKDFIDRVHDARLYMHHVRDVNMIDVYTLCDNKPMGEMGNRLKWAREHAGWKSGRKAANDNHWKISTYLAHENGQNDFDEETARKYGRVFHVSAGWLLTGEGSPTRATIVGVKGLIGAGGTIDTSVEQIEAGGNLHEIEVLFPIPEGAFALEVRGESMYPRYDPGDVIVCAKPVTGNLDQFVGRIVAVQTINGARYLKRLAQNPRRGLFDLESHNANPIKAVRLQWAAPIQFVIPADQWQKIDLRRAEAS